MPTGSITGQLLTLLNGQRGTPLQRYVSMDAFAQDEADAGGPAFRGPYARVAVAQADTAREAYLLVSTATNGYTNIGIGYHDGYWVVVLN